MKSTISIVVRDVGYGLERWMEMWGPMGSDAVCAAVDGNGMIFHYRAALMSVCVCPTDQVMRDTFSEFGSILDVRVFKDKGFSFIRYSTCYRFGVSS